MIGKLELRDYKYNELCEIMNEKVKKGKSRILQLENWKRYFEWENPTSHIYRITKIYDVPKQKENHRGGARDGAGAKVKVQEEFNILIQGFLQDSNSVADNQHDAVEGKKVIYFTNDAMCKYFGIYKDIYQALYVDIKGKLLDKDLNLAVYSKITDKLMEKYRSWIINKISKLDGVELSYSVLCYYDDKEYEYRDDLWDIYAHAEEKFLKDHNCLNTKDVKNKNKWDHMMNYIRKQINEYLNENEEGTYIEIRKVRKLAYDPKIISDGSINENTIKIMRKRINEKVIHEVYEYFWKKIRKELEARLHAKLLITGEKERMKDYEYVLQKYVKIGGNDSETIHPVTQIVS